jgi:hypothetical protein
MTFFSRFVADADLFLVVFLVWCIYRSFRWNGVRNDVLSWCLGRLEPPHVRNGRWSLIRHGIWMYAHEIPFPIIYYYSRLTISSPNAAGIRGVWVGSVLGGCLALPVALVEIGIRYLLPEEEIFPVMEIKSDPPQSVSKSIAEELELQLDVQKHFEEKSGDKTAQNSSAAKKK